MPKIIVNGTQILLISVHPRTELIEIHKKSAFYSGQIFVLIVKQKLQPIDNTIKAKKGATTKCAKRAKNRCR